MRSIDSPVCEHGWRATDWALLNPAPCPKCEAQGFSQPKPTRTRIAQSIPRCRHGHPLFLSASCKDCILDAMEGNFPDVIEHDGVKLYRRRDKEIHDEVVYQAHTEAQELAHHIAEAIAEQNEEFDNLGDNESISFTGNLPTINLVQLAEDILVRTKK